MKIRLTKEQKQKHSVDDNNTRKHKKYLKNERLYNFMNNNE